MDIKDNLQALRWRDSLTALDESLGSGEGGGEPGEEGGVEHGEEGGFERTAKGLVQDLSPGSDTGERGCSSRGGDGFNRCLSRVCQSLPLTARHLIFSHFLVIASLRSDMENSLAKVIAIWRWWLSPLQALLT
jgi:hypothetical protein